MAQCQVFSAYLTRSKYIILYFHGAVKTNMLNCICKDATLDSPRTRKGRYTGYLFGPAVISVLSSLTCHLLTFDDTALSVVQNIMLFPLLLFNL
ncbi:Hypothetical predicted protein [Pelobates cultripes]|uniref:Uncharacterized protein n=1 Tax=Pelobates cultripes TaxID=61616 RepID=A0AAD1VV38_PELCU|nr:Hypothetical predicted protein [Pelobates cultripes]